jgi:hypothetical protein
LLLPHEEEEKKSWMKGAEFGKYTHDGMFYTLIILFFAEGEGTCLHSMA